MAKEKVDDVEKEYGAVLYTDGATGPSNPGPTGSGLHGYIYPLDTLGKKTANRPTKYAITNIGYIHVDELEREAYQDVTPSYYVNGCFTYKGTGTNNIGEMQAVTIGLLKIGSIDLPIKKLVIKLDSEYVIAVYKHVSNYNNVAWRDKDLKNKEFLEQLREAIKFATDKGIEVELIKVKGHSNSLGNNNADRLAVMARLYALHHDVEDIDFNIIPAKGYYGSGTADRHAFLRFKNLFFMGLTNAKTPYSIYSVMQYEKDVEPGRSTHNATFGLVYLKEKQPMIEDAIGMFCEKTHPLSVVASLDLDLIYSREHLNLYGAFKRKMYVYDRYFQAIKFRDEDSVIVAIRPPGRASTAIERTIHLYDIIDEYNSIGTKEPLRTYVDITDKIFTKNAKGATVIGITNQDSYMVFDVEVGGTPIKVPIYIGKDCITRDHFKQIEDTEPKVMLVLKKVGEMVNYYILIDCQKTGDKSVWCNFFNNNVILEKPIKLKK